MIIRALTIIEEQYLIPRINRGTKATPLLKWISQEIIAPQIRILEMMLLEKRVRLPSLRSCDRGKLRAEVRNVNEAAKSIQTYITELNSLMHIAAYATTERTGMVKRKVKRTEEPFWMERKEKGQNNLTQLKQPPFGERYGLKKSVTMNGLLG